MVISFRIRWQYALVALMIAIFVSLGSDRAADIDHSAVVVKLPSNILWSGSPTSGAQSAILMGDPSKPGLYIELTKWHPHNMSRPHFHPNDRFITVISGIWWKGTGTKYDPESTVPIPAGSFVTDVANGIHYDGAKDEEVVLEIVGMGPATSASAEVK
jgi:hypothetical protein